MSCGCQSPYTTINNCCNQCACQCTCPTTTTSTTTLTPCLCYRVRTQSTNVTIPYMDCVTREMTSSVQSDGDNICAVKDSIVLSPTFDYICTVSGTCSDNETCITTTTTTVSFNPPLPQTTFVPNCGILVTGWTGGDDNASYIYLYNPVNNSLRALNVPGATGQGVGVYDDIAHTHNKLWLVDTNNSQFVEYNITLSPFTAVFNQNIPFPSGFVSSYGLFALSDHELLVGNDNNVPPGSTVIGRYNITTNMFYPLFTIPVGQQVLGDFILTSNNKVIISIYDNNTGHVHILQYDYITHALELDIDVTGSTSAFFSNPDGLFEYNGEIYIVDGNDGIYKIDTTSPYNITLIGRPIGGFVSVNQEYYTGASQASDTCECCASVSFITTTTTTAAPTTSTTSTTTTIPCHCITFTNSSNTAQIIYYKPCNGGTDIQTTVPAFNSLIPTSGTVNYCGLVGGTYAPTYVTITHGANCVSGACPTTTTSSTTTTTTIPCNCYTLSTSSTSQIAVYTDCVTGTSKGITLSNGVPQKICAQNVIPASGLSILSSGICADKINCPGTTSTTSTTSSTTSTTTVFSRPCNCITFRNSSNISKQISYTSCSGSVISGITIPALMAVNYCGTNGTTNDGLSVFITEGAPCNSGNPCTTTTTTTLAPVTSPCRSYYATNTTSSVQYITATVCSNYTIGGVSYPAGSVVTIPVVIGGTVIDCIANVSYNHSLLYLQPMGTSCPTLTPPPPPPLSTTTSNSSTTSTSSTTTSTSTTTSSTTTTTTSNCKTCILLESVADVPRSATYTNCNGVSAQVLLVPNVPTIICTNTLSSLDLTNTVDISYVELGSCNGGSCTPFDCSCYLIMNNSELHYAYYTYLPCGYNVDDPQLSIGTQLAPFEYVYICSVSKPSISDSNGDNDNGITLPYVNVIKLDNLNCAVDECGSQTAYCYTINATGGSISYAWLSYDGFAVDDSLGNGESITICAQPGSIVQIGGAGTLNIGSAGSNCTATNGDCTPIA